MSLRLYFDFTNYRSGNSKRVEIYDANFSGTASAIPYGTDEPLIEKCRATREDSEKSIFGREMEFSFWVLGNGADYDFLMTSDYQELLMITKTAGSTDFVGWIKTENIKRGYKDEGYYSFKLTATDGLANLKDEPYLNLSGVPYRGKDYLLNIIDHARLRLRYGIITDALEYEIILNTYETNLMTSDQCALIETYGRNSRLYKKNEGKTEPDSAYKAIEKILKNFNCKMRQINGKWYIYNPNEPTSYSYNVPRDASGFIDLTGVTRNSISNILNITGKYTPWGEMSSVYPLKGYEIKLRNKSIGEEYTGVDEWDTEWTKAGMNVLSEASDHLKFEIPEEYYRLYPPDDFASTITSDVFSVARRTDNDYIKVSFDYRTNTYISLFGIKDDAAYFRIVLISPSGTTKVLGGYLSSGAYETLATDNVEALKVTEDGDYQIQIEFYVNSNIAEPKVEVELDGKPEITLVSVGDGTTINENLTFDKSFTITQTGGRGVKTDETVYGDSGNTSDVAALTDSAGNLTETWSRYNETENRPLIELCLQNRLNNRKDFAEYVTIEYWDDNEEISPEKVILMDSKHYEILGYEKNHKNGKYKMNLLQIYPHTLYGDV
jgi:hypothetical protein